MRQVFHFTQTDLEKFATNVEELSDWIEEKIVLLETQSLIIPPQLTFVGIFVVTAGISMFLDGQAPDGRCWGSNSGCST